MKKALSILLAIVMVISMIPMSVFAAETEDKLTISFETDFNNELLIGETFTVTAKLSNNTSFGTMTLSLKWNEQAVAFNGFNASARGALESDVFPGGDYAKAEINQELGIIVAADIYGYDTNGVIFTANFTIVGDGELDIGLKTDTASEFQIKNVDGSEDISATLDFSAISGLTVGGKPVGPEIPEDAPFTAITTDVGPIVAIEEVKEAFEVLGVPYYIVTIPADAETAYVTAPDQVVMEDWMTGAMQATAYASDLSFSSDPEYISFNYEVTADGPKVEIPLYWEGAQGMNGPVDLCFVADENKEVTHAFGIEDAGYACLGWISFVYDDGSANAPSYEITPYEAEGGSVYAMNEDDENIEEAKEGDLVYLDVYATNGYAAKTWGYIYEGQTYHCENGCFSMPAGDVELFAEFQKNHTHTYDQEIVADEYLKDAATCKSGAVYYKSCECGEFVTTAETFVSGEPVPCVYGEDGTCKWCGEAAAAGYTVTMSEDAETVAGEEVTVSVAVGHTNETVTKYNAFDMIFAYNATALELLTTEIEGMDITVEGGKIYIKRYGPDLALTTPVVSLKFKALAAGTTEVNLVSAKVDIADKALTQDAPEAIVNDAATAVTVTGYAINLSEDFQGETNAEPGKDYTFTAKDKNYNYTVTATVNGQAITVTDNGDGTFTIPANQITGAVTVTATKTGKTFAVTVRDDLAGAEQAQYMTDYTAKLTKEAGYGYTITVTIGGTEYKGFAYDEATGVITIPGKDITGAVVINTGKVPGEFTVTFAGAGAGEAKGEAVAEGGKAYTFTIEAAPGYTYAVTYIMGDATEAIELTAVEGKYTIEKVTANIVITIEKTSDLAVEVKEYVKLNGKSVMLITATQTLAEGEALSYDGTVMFYSEQYKAWCYLVIAEGTLTAEEAKTAITNGVAAFTTLTQTYNVNGVGTVDINDAQLVYNLYNNMYQDFTVATMEKFLNADVNGDKVINVTDAAAVVSQIANAK